MKNNLENFFRKRLKNELPEEAHWNIPSEEGWNKLRAQLDDKKKRNSFWVLWVIIGLLGLGLGYSFYSIKKLEKRISGEKKHIVSDRINAQSPASIMPSLSVPSDIPHSQSFPSKPNAAHNPKVTLSPAKKHKLKSDIPPYAKRKNAYQPAPLIQQGKLLKERANVSKSASELREVHLVNGHNYAVSNKAYIPIANHPNTVVIPLKKELTNRKINVEKLNAYEVKQLKHNRFVLFPDRENPPGIEEESVHRKFIEISAGPMWTALPLKGDIPGDFETLWGSDKFVASQSAGIDIGMELKSHLFLKIGAHYQGIRYWSQSEIISTYDKYKEFLAVDGRIHNIHELEVPTALGMMKSKLNIALPSNMNISDGALIKTIIDLHQRLDYVSFPLNVEYHIPLGNKSLTAVLGAGMSYNQLLTIHDQMTPTITHNGQAIPFVSLEHQNMKPPNTFDYLTSLGLRYALSGRYEFGITAGYFSNLTPVMELESMSARIHGWKLSFALVRKF